MKRTSSGRRNVPIKAVVYGDSGVGKTTMAANAPGAVILDLEHGSSHLDVARVEVDTFAEVLEVVRETRTGSLVVDSLTQLEQIITDDILGPDRKPTDTLATFGRGYGQGNELLLMKWREFLAAVDRCPANVILIAHAQQKPYSDPTGLSYDRWVLHLNEKLSNATQRFADYVLFARFANETRKTDKKTVGITGERVIQTDANAAWLAKHRGSLPESLPLDWTAFQDAVEADRGDAENTRKGIGSMIEQVEDAELASKMNQALEAAGSDTNKLGALMRRVEAKLNEKKEKSE